MDKVQKGSIHSKVIRDVTYSIDLKTDDVVMGDITFNAKTNFDEEKFVFVLTILESETFAKFLEEAMKLRLNEEKVGVDVLKEKYKTSYDSLKQSVYELCSQYVMENIMIKQRASKVYLKEFFESDEFKTLLEKLMKEVKQALKERNFEKIPLLVRNSEIHDEVDKRDVLIGNYEVRCDAYETNGKTIITNIKWCSANCPKFVNCPVYEKMKGEDAFNYSLNMEFLNA